MIRRLGQLVRCVVVEADKIEGEIDGFYESGLLPEFVIFVGSAKQFLRTRLHPIGKTKCIEQAAVAGGLQDRRVLQSLENIVLCLGKPALHLFSQCA